jgi:hypothetical protein
MFMKSDFGKPENAVIEDRHREECGIFAVYDHEEASKVTYLAYTLSSTGGRRAPASLSQTGSVLSNIRRWVLFLIYLTRRSLSP